MPCISQFNDHKSRKLRKEYRTLYGYIIIRKYFEICYSVNNDLIPKTKNDCKLLEYRNELTDPYINIVVRPVINF